MRRAITDITSPAEANAGLRTLDIVWDEDRAFQLRLGMRENTSLFDEEPHLAVTGNQPSKAEMIEIFAMLAGGLVTGDITLL